MCCDVSPKLDIIAPVAPVQPVISHELITAMVEPCFKQMCCNVNSHVFAQQIPLETIASREWLRMMCEPLFEEVITAVQHSIVQQAVQQTCVKHPVNEAMQAQSMNMPGVWNTNTPDVCTFPLYDTTSSFNLDDESTEASDSCAFASLFTIASSEGECSDAIEGNSETSERSNNDDKTVMVCKHWKSKGWCRLGSNCKFLHPEHKRGCCTHVSTDHATLCVPSMARRRRGGKNRSIRGQKDQIGSVFAGHSDFTV
jgi:hypothetical protein